MKELELERIERERKLLELPKTPKNPFAILSEHRSGRALNEDSDEDGADKVPQNMADREISLKMNKRNEMEMVGKGTIDLINYQAEEANKKKTAPQKGRNDNNKTDTKRKKGKDNDAK